MPAKYPDVSEIIGSSTPADHQNPAVVSRAAVFRMSHRFSETAHPDSLPNNSGSTGSDRFLPC